MKKKSFHIVLLISVGFFSIPSCFNKDGGDDQRLPEKVSYNFHIRPILSDKCFACHGPDKNARQAGLRLDVADSAYAVLKESPGQYAIVPGNPLNSVVFSRISSEDTSELMPPPSSHLSLNSFEVRLIERWIRQGATYEKHWAFTAPVKSAVPKVDNEAWAKNEIDRFILHTLEERKSKPNPESDRERLLKKVSLDVTGLLPSEKMMDDFLNDKSENAYEKIVDTLLAQRSYGEQMALLWMDLARYADSHGYQDDGYRTQWPWRDWVIYAFNKNLSYKDFVSWQIAGDLLPDRSKEQLLATGFNRNHKITEEGGVIDEEYRVEYVTDRTNTFSKAILGITMECAHCHDHKYDPFSQKEHYELFAFFNNVTEVGQESVIGGPETYAKKPFMSISNEDANTILHFVNKKDTGKLIVSIMGERDTARKSYILDRGQYDQHKTEVYPSTPEAILPFKPSWPKNRLGLAEWLFDSANPLTARVFVNLLWQEFFGTGIVKTSGDFGMQGALPTHPELLDWLSVDFRENGWDIKRLVRQMVTSATYRQSVITDPDKRKKDPENKWLSYSSRNRVKAETVRDIILGSAGVLNKEIGGPSVKPYQPSGLWEAAASTGGSFGILGTYKQDHQEKLYRRGMYTFIKRTVPPPSMMIFDASNRDQCEVFRLKTNTPLQALVMMNDPVVLEASRLHAAKMMNEEKSADKMISRAFRRIECRTATGGEMNVLMKFYNEELNSLTKEKAVRLLQYGESKIDTNLDIVQLAALTKVINTIYNLEETIVR
ncbi:PSD1 and planctomycete cytochrome C domain-containing protein [Pollutibacter soli]|uniref:PSD1 and planctomycete cytochrome C domain-containing protein n=1 Tax=Pollutibacter soli TaxID=3034157 RepID=UPI003013A565